MRIDKGRVLHSNSDDTLWSASLFILLAILELLMYYSVYAGSGVLESTFCMFNMLKFAVPNHLKGASSRLRFYH